MGISKRQLAHGRFVYWIGNTWQGKRVWERAGNDAREARRLDRQRKQEIRDGVFTPKAKRTYRTFGQWCDAWLDERTGRNADDEVAAVRRYVLTRAWLTELHVQEVRPMHMAQLVKELKTTISETTGKPLGEKTVANIYGVIRTCMRDARRLEIILTEPCVLDRGTFSRRGAKRRTTYAPGDVVALIVSPKVALTQRVWNALAFFTGMRQGEVCGRTWKDWARDAEPLGALHVTTQYDGQPLKTEDRPGDQPRVVPVHPRLAELFDWWWREGFELAYLRPPTLEDPIVPTATLAHHTKSTSYKAWRRACEAAGVENRTLHSARHTFISMCRRAGARKDVLERVTHNARGDIIDEYTHFDWAPLCEAVECMRCDFSVSHATSEAIEWWRRRESKTGPSAVSGGIRGELAAAEPPLERRNYAEVATHDLDRDPPNARASGACPDCLGTGAFHSLEVDANGRGGAVLVADCPTCGLLRRFRALSAAWLRRVA